MRQPLSHRFAGWPLEAFAAPRPWLINSCAVPHFGPTALPPWRLMRKQFPVPFASIHSAANWNNKLCN